MGKILLYCLMMTASATAWGCSSTPKAMDVCKKLEAAGVAANCQEKPAPSGPAAIAKERVIFDIPKIATELPGEVMTFNEDRDYLNTVKTYNALGTYNGMHRHGSAKRRVFVAIDGAAPPELAEKAKQVVDAL